MINRFRTRCKTCGHNNTLRITLGTEEHQEHTFSCAGCGLTNRVSLSIDFENRTPLIFGGIPTEEIPEQLRAMSQPTAQFHTLENCIQCEEEGTITNLDPNFLIPSDLLHQDRVFSWMLEARKIGIQNKNIASLPSPHINDIIMSIGGVRQLRKGIATLAKAWVLVRAGRNDLSEKIVTEFCTSVGIIEQLSVNQFAAACAEQFNGNTRKPEITSMVDEVRACAENNPREFMRLHAYLSRNFEEILSKQIDTLVEYSKGYDQFSQTLVYAIRGTSISGDVVASSKDLQAVRMFYGNCFEALAAGFDLPACLNNIISGRAYDEFESMNLRKYLTINKANRARPFANNHNFSHLFAEFDSTLRNSSHHGALRLCNAHPEFLEYRSGDTGIWKKISYTDYLLKCNRIMICAMQLLLLQVIVFESAS